MKLDLPSTTRLARQVHRIGFPLDRGVLPSLEDYRSRQKLRGRGLRAGFGVRGRVCDFDVTQTLLGREPAFRERWTAPRRDVRVLVDLGTNDASRSMNRLLSTAVVVAGAIASRSDARARVGSLGGRRAVSPFLASSPGALPALTRFVQAMGRIRPDLHMHAGKLRRACLDDSPEHVVLVTHWLPPAMIRQVAFPLGLTIFLVRPEIGSASGHALGVSGGWAAFGSSLTLEDELDTRYESFLADVRGRASKTYLVDSGGPTLEAVLASVGLGRLHEKRPSRRGPIRSLLDRLR